MIKIINKLKDKEILVTKGAYENLYKSLGYTIVDAKETTIPKPKVEEKVVSKPTIKEEKHESDDLLENIMAKKSSRKKG